MEKNTPVEKKEKFSASHVKFRDAEIPESTEIISNKGWVKWGPDNLFPQFLWYLFYCSPIHQGVISSKVDYIISGGLSFEGDEAEWNKVFQNGASDYDLDEVAELLCLDNEVSNSYNILCKRPNTSTPWYIEQIDFELIRPDEEGIKFYYSENWSTDAQSYDKTAYREIPSFFHRKPDSLECILQIKTKSRQRITVPGNKSKTKVTGGFFSVPSYSGGYESIMTDIEINYFRFAEVINGYKGGSILYLGNGEPENEVDRDKILKDLKLEVTDRRKQGGIGVIFGEGDNGKPTVEQLSGNDLDKRYESTETGLLSKIMISHSVTNPKLFAVMATNAMSETNDQASFDRFQKTYANKRRKSIVSSMNFALKKLNGMKGEIVANIPSLTADEVLDESAKFVAKMNTMSSIVANAGLNVLTDNEKRKYIWDLPPIPGGDTLPTNPANVAMRAKFGSDPVVLGFESVGRPFGTFRVIKSRELKEFEIDNDEDFLEEFRSQKFDSALSDLQLNILRLISEDKTTKQIQAELNLSSSDLAKQLKTTDKLGYTDGLKLTEKGQVEIVNIEEIEVVYSYEVRPDAPPLKGKSRPFCVEMIKLNRVYTRAEINAISAAIGRNVWLYRGGWYHNPETDENQPSCRHYWLQNLVTKRG